MVGRDRVRRHAAAVGAHGDPHAGDRRGRNVRGDRGDHRVRPLPGDQPARDVAGRNVRDDGVLAAGGDAVDLKRRALPEPLERGEAGLADHLVETKTGAVGLLVEGDPADLRASRLRQFGDPVVEAIDGDPAVGAVQAREDVDERVQRVGDGAAEAAGVQVFIGTLDDDVEGGQPLGGDRQRRLARTPHRTVGRDDQVGGELLGVRAEVGRQVRAPDLLLALEEELHVQRQSALLLEEGLRDLEHEVDGPLVVAAAAAAHDVAVDGELERWGRPLGEVSGGLHVVVAIDQDRRGLGPTEPVGAHHGVALGGHHVPVGERQLRGEPLRRSLHGRGARVTADARDGDVRRELGQVVGVVRVKGEHGRRRSRGSGR